MMTLTLLTLLAAPAWASEAQQLRYTLSINSQEVGQRELKVVYLPGQYQEVRLIESWTELTVPLGPKSLRYTQRMTGMGGSGGFVSVIQEGRTRMEVQAAAAPSGWTVTVAEGGEAKVYALGPEAFDMSSLLLVDPGSADRLEGRSQLKVLAAESGGVLEGPLRASGPVRVAVGGQSLTATEYVWSVPEAEMTLAYGEHGHLLRYSTQVLGMTVQGVLDAPPPERSWGSALEGPLIDQDQTVREQEM